MRRLCVTVLLASVLWVSVSAQQSTVQTLDQAIAEAQAISLQVQGLIAKLLALRNGLAVPVDEVVERVLVRSESLGCQPTNFTHAIETYEYRTVTPASNGGKPYEGPRTETVINEMAEPCVYVAPTGVIRYFVEIGTHDHSFTDVPAMQEWVRTSGANVAATFPGGNPPSRLDYEVLSGPKSFTFPTYTEFAAFISTFVQTEPPPSNEPKPGPVPPAGWEQGDCSLGGYPEQRVYASFQWHFNKLHLHDLDERNTAHMHIEGCVPIPGQRVTGQLRLDWKVVAFHMEGFILREVQLKSYDVPASAVTVDPFHQNAPITEHVQTFYAPAVIDMTGATTLKGPDFRMDLLTFRETFEGREDHVVFGEINDGNWLSTGRKLFKPVGGAEFTALPYLGVRMPLWNTAGPALPWVTPFSATDQGGGWQIRSDGPKPLQFRAAWNPDLHQHPPVYGTVLVDGIFLDGKTTFRVSKPEGMVRGDRVMFRVADLTGTREHGASAALLVLKLR